MRCTETITLYEIFKKIKKNRLQLNRELESQYSWDNKKQSLFVESILLGIPLPSFYFVENHDGDLVVLSGLKRIATIERYLKSEFSLELMESQLDGQSYDDLSANLQNRIEDCPVTVHTIDSTVTDSVVIEVFRRVSHSSLHFAQYARHCMYFESPLKLLNEFIKNMNFLKLIKNKVPEKKMWESWLVNRFILFYLIKKSEVSLSDESFENMLGEALIISEEQDEEWKNSMAIHFQNSMENCFLVFGDSAFINTEAKDNAIDVALWDVFSVLMGEISTQQVIDCKDKLKETCLKLFQDNEFLKSLQSLNSLENVKKRLSIANQYLGELHND